MAGDGRGVGGEHVEVPAGAAKTLSTHGVGALIPTVAVSPAMGHSSERRSMDDQRRLAAIHEAGHAVAATMRGGA